MGDFFGLQPAIKRHALQLVNNPSDWKPFHHDRRRSTRSARALGLARSACFGDSRELALWTRWTLPSASTSRIPMVACFILEESAALSLSTVSTSCRRGAHRQGPLRSSQGQAVVDEASPPHSRTRGRRALPARQGGGKGRGGSAARASAGGGWGALPPPAPPPAPRPPALPGLGMPLVGRPGGVSSMGFLACIARCRPCCRRSGPSASPASRRFLHSKGRRRLARSCCRMRSALRLGLREDVIHQI